MSDLRLLFVTDPHGSSAVLSKSLEEAVKRRVDMLILSGDLEGKYLLFLEERGDKLCWEDPVNGSPRTDPKERLPQVLAEIARCGAYGVVVPRGFDVNREPREELDQRLRTEAASRMLEWVNTLDAWTRETGILVCMMAGNDDPPEFDDIIRDASQILFIDEMVIETRGYRIAGISQVPPSPWHTPRELSEQELGGRLERLVELGNKDLPLILVAHTPPYSCGLDNAPLLDENRRQIVLGGVMQTGPVGSRSLRSFLEARPDIPLALHGHVHESPGWARLSSTLCINPGTEYFAGVLVASFVLLEDGVVKRFEGVRR